MMPFGAQCHVKCFKCFQCRESLLKSERFYFVPRELKAGTPEALAVDEKRAPPAFFVFCNIHRPRQSKSLFSQGRAHSLRHLTRDRPVMKGKRPPNASRTLKALRKEEELLSKSPNVSSASKPPLSDGTSKRKGSKAARFFRALTGGSEAEKDIHRTAESSSIAAPKQVQAAMSTAKNEGSGAAGGVDGVDPALVKLFEDAGISARNVEKYSQLCAAKNVALDDFLRLTRPDMVDLGILSAHQLLLMHSMKKFKDKLAKRSRSEVRQADKERKRREKEAKARAKAAAKLRRRAEKQAKKNKTKLDVPPDAFVCGICSERCVDLSALTAHRENVHDLKPEDSHIGVAVVKKSVASSTTTQPMTTSSGELSKPASSYLSALLSEDDDLNDGDRKTEQMVRSYVNTQPALLEEEGSEDESEDSHLSSAESSNAEPLDATKMRSGESVFDKLLDDTEAGYESPHDDWAVEHPREVEAICQSLTLTKAMQRLHDVLGEERDDGGQNVVIHCTPGRVRAMMYKPTVQESGIMSRFKRAPTMIRERGVIVEKDGLLFVTKLAVYFASHDQVSDQKVVIVYSYDDLACIEALHGRRIVLRAESGHGFEDAIVSSVPDRALTLEVMQTLWRYRREEEDLLRYKMSAIQAEVEFDREVREIEREQQLAKEAEDAKTNGGGTDGSPIESGLPQVPSKSDASVKFAPIRLSESSSPELRAELESLRNDFNIFSGDDLYLLCECTARLYHLSESDESSDSAEHSLVADQTPIKGMMYITRGFICVRELRLSDSSTPPRLVRVKWHDVVTFDKRLVQSFAGMLESYAIEVICESGQGVRTKGFTLRNTLRSKKKRKAIDRILKPDRISFVKVSQNLDDVFELTQHLWKDARNRLPYFGTKLQEVLHVEEAERRRAVRATLSAKDTGWSLFGRKEATEEQLREASLAEAEDEAQRDAPILAHSSLSAQDAARGLPMVLRKLCGRVAECLDTEGLFRISPSKAAAEAVRDAFDNHIEVDLRDQPVALVCFLVKDFLRMLPQPLLTHDAYQCFMVLKLTDKSGGEAWREKIDPLVSILRMLPRENIIVLRYLFAFLRLVASHSDKNKMNKKNLATIFGPALLRSKEADAAAQSATVARTRVKKVRKKKKTAVTSATAASDAALAKSTMSSAVTAFKESAHGCTVVLFFLEHGEEVFREMQRTVDADTVAAKLEEGKKEEAAPKKTRLFGRAPRSDNLERKSFDSFVIGYKMNCVKCGEVGLPGEIIMVQGLIYHRKCFVCDTCGVTLSAQNYTLYGEQGEYTYCMRSECLLVVEEYTEELDEDEPVAIEDIEFSETNE